MVNLPSNPVEKTREQRAKELQERLAQATKTEVRENVPFLKLVDAGKIDAQGFVTVKIDALAVLEGMHESESGKSKVNFDTFALEGIGRFNVTAIQKLAKA